MKTRTKALLLVMSALLLVVSTVFATMAYLTSTTETVKNTFTVGNVTITLDEAPVDIYGALDGTTRRTENAYKLLPGHKYIKDPTVHVQALSEACFVYVKVVNGIDAIVANNGNDVLGIEEQILAKGWTELPGYTGVYYKNVDLATATAGTDLIVFEYFTVTDDAVLADSDGNALYSADTPITITGYAIQADGFEGDAVAAWEAGNFN